MAEKDAKSVVAILKVIAMHLSTDVKDPRNNKNICDICLLAIL